MGFFSFRFIIDVDALLVVPADEILMSPKLILQFNLISLTELPSLKWKVTTTLIAYSLSTKVAIVKLAIVHIASP